MAQAVLPIIGLAVFTLSRVSGTSDAGEYVPDLGHYYTFAGLCIACGLVLAVAIYHRERQGASRPAPDAEAPASRGLPGVRSDTALHRTPTARSSSSSSQVGCSAVC